ncbi:hypothetical protein KY336_03020 [Candidatus Woesearchaeota archaeon]|nr:hypothetical protein [Candidatus Woesearchaeota archaeon]
MRKIRKTYFLIISVLFIFLFSIMAVGQDLDSLPAPPATPSFGTTGEAVPPPAEPGEEVPESVLTSAERQQYETQVQRLEQEKINLQNSIEQLQQQKLQLQSTLQNQATELAEARKKKPNYPFYISLAVIVLLLIFILFKILPKKTKPGMPKAKPFDPDTRKLVDFVRKAKMQGYDYEAVCQHLIDSGWSQEQIDKAYTYLK